MALALLALSVPTVTLAQKTDVIVLTSGDRITGEIKSAEQGLLRLSTDSLSTVQIEIEDIAEITSTRSFVINDMNGRILVGTLQSTGPGRISVRLADGSATAIDLKSLVRLQQLGQAFWDRLNGAIDLGASYTKSSGVGQASLTAYVEFRKPGFETSTRLASTFTLQSEAQDTSGSLVTSRNQLNLSYVKILRNRWLAPGLGLFENNGDLGLKLRSTLGGGVGRMLVLTIRQRLMAAGGISVNKEVPSEGESTSNTEAFIVLTHQHARYNSPKTQLNTQLFVFPSLSDAGRLRLSFDSSVRRELFKDFTVGLSLYDTFDNRPPTETAARNDVGVSLTVGWSY